ncbi:agamous-like MADS-box protein AGL29 [Triticum dicoccoides]|uniref:agamous-like MADS-box protein AGL29 n=1 Tax=Triticum dicoccoides TaxID=85692 RepID=UPI0018905027|nr:agamous-like MADS-box protein AGL29 [Triticum dicoccoides]
MAMKMKTKKGGTGRKKRDEMKLIEDPAKRQVAFSKRRPTLFGMAGDLSALCGVHVAVVVFSRSARGNAYAFGSPSVDAVLRRCHHHVGGQDEDAALAIVHGDDDDAGALAALRRELDDTKARVEAEKKRMKAVEAKVELAMAARSTALWWQADVEALGAAELPEFETALRRLRDTLLRRVDALQLPLAVFDATAPLACMNI